MGGKPGESSSGAVSEFFKRFVVIERFFKFTDSLVIIYSSLLPFANEGGSLGRLDGVVIAEPALRLVLIILFAIMLPLEALFAELRRLPELIIEDFTCSFTTLSSGEGGPESFWPVESSSVVFSPIVGLL